MNEARHARATAVEHWVRINPGYTCLEIAQYLGLEPALVRVALQDSRKAARVKSQGVTRGTKWYPVGRA